MLGVVLAGALAGCGSSEHRHARARPGADGPVFPGAPRAQRGVWRGGYGGCPLARPTRYLPRRAGCVSVAYANVTGQHSRDLVVLYGVLTRRRETGGYGRFGGYVPRRFELAVWRSPSGAPLRIAVPGDGGSDPLMLRVAEVRAPYGAAIFARTSVISSGSSVAVYAYDSRRLVQATDALGYGGDSGIQAGFTCPAGRPARIVQHAFELQGGWPDGPWQRTDTTYTWTAGARLRIAVKRTSVWRGRLPRRLISADC